MRAAHDGPPALRRALILRLTGEESRTNAHALAETLRAAGCEPSIVSYWPDEHDVLPHQGLDDGVLLATGIDSAERLSAFAFRRRFGFDLDMIDLAAHSIASAPLHADQILPESPWNQHLRGVAAAFSGLLERVAPDFVFVPHGAEVVSRALAEMVAHRGIRHLYWESPFFPGHHFVDPKAPHFFRGACRLDTSWGEEPPTPEALQATAAYIDRWRAEKASKYSQHTSEKSARRLENWLARSDSKVLFVPGQVSTDANVVIGLGDHANLQAIYSTLFDGVPGGWRVIFKPHPKDPAPLGWRDIPHEVLLAEDISIHDLFAASDAVAVHSSNVGLEALMTGLPVLTWGRPLYGDKGVVIDLADVRDVAATLAAGTPTPPSPDDVNAVVHHILRHGLVRAGDAETMRARMAEASHEAPAPRLPWYGRPVQAFAAACRALDERLQRNLPMVDALADLDDSDREVLTDRFEQKLLAHSLGGAITKERLPRFRGPSADLGRGLAAPLGLRVKEQHEELQQCIDPVRAFRAIAVGVDAETAVAFTMLAPGARDDAIQSLGPDDIEHFAATNDPPLQADVFGLDDLQVMEHPDDAPRHLVILRDAGLAALTVGERAAVVGATLVFAPCDVPADLFLYRDPPTFEEGDALVRLGTRTAHLVYGPVVPLPAGTWHVTFDTRFKRRGGLLTRLLTRDQSVTLDVNEIHVAILAKQRVSTAGVEEPITLTFSARPDVDYEFRVLVHGGKEAAVLRFGGVRIHADPTDV